MYAIVPLNVVLGFCIFRAFLCIKSSFIMINWYTNKTLVKICNTQFLSKCSSFVFFEFIRVLNYNIQFMIAMSIIKFQCYCHKWWTVNIFVLIFLWAMQLMTKKWENNIEFWWNLMPYSTWYHIILMLVCVFADYDS